MYEKVNPSHPDKVADRIAGAIVDLAYKRQENPRIAVEVLIGHGYCYVIAESSVDITFDDVESIAERIIGAKPDVRLVCVPQDVHLSDNQKDAMHCGDNGIFKGVAVSDEEQWLTKIVGMLYNKYPTDGKYIVSGNEVIACQSCCDDNELELLINTNTETNTNITVNPLGPWTGGPNVDAGATNRKLGSDMGRGVTGGGLHGKDLSKADVSVNILCHMIAQERKTAVRASCAIGDEGVDFYIENTGSIISLPYDKVVENARQYINMIGGFEKFAEWGLIRP